MLTINKIIPGGRGLAPALLRRAAFVELDWDVRQRSRFEALDSAGTSLAIFLPRGAVVRGGDVLVAEDGSLRRVRAAPQPLMVVRACPEHGSAHDLLRAAASAKATGQVGDGTRPARAATAASSG
jgi:urease accessory protein